MLTLQSFDHAFSVRAPLDRVAVFHCDARALRCLTPPPLVVQLHHGSHLAEGSLADFTLWFGPLPVCWQAVHSDVDALHGFTDVQRGGPMRWWKHTHHFDAIDAQVTRVSDHIDYAYHRGWRRLFGLALFNPLALRLLFFLQGLATRAALETGPRR